MTPDTPHPDFHEFVKSHFSHGVVTFHPATCSALRRAGRCGSRARPTTSRTASSP
ncbi:MAG: hypothetical protein WDN45_14025 [Caulobacteraceae bacterium]